MTIGIVMNPHAGSRKLRRWSTARLREYLGEEARIVETTSLDEIPQALLELRQQNIDTLVPFGGDGTISRVLAAALQIWGDALPRFAVVRAGTINMIANDLAMPRVDPAQSLRSLLRNGAGREQQRRSMRTACGHAGFTFGFGAPVKFLQHYDGSGLPGAARLIAKAAISLPKTDGIAAQMFEPVDVNWTDAQGEHCETSVRLFLAMTIDELSLGFRVAPGAAADSDHMHLIHGRFSAAFVLRNLHRFHRGDKVTGPDMSRQSTTAVGFSFPRPSAWMMDGEVHEAVESLRLELGPMLRFVQCASQ